MTTGAALLVGVNPSRGQGTPPPAVTVPDACELVMVAALLPVIALENEELMVITQQGMILRMKAGDVRVIGRATQGVRLIEMEDGDRVVAIAKLAEKDAARAPKTSRVTTRADAKAAKLAEKDEDVADYVRSLEETRDTADLPEASGEAIAREFERFLRRSGDDPTG